MAFLRTSAATLLLLSVFACGGSGTSSPKSPVPTAPQPPNQPGSAPSSTPSATLHISFSQVQTQLLNPDCVSCHSGPRPSFGLDFTTYNNVAHNPVLPNLVVPGQPGRSALFSDIQGGVAPGGVPVTQDQIDLLFNWIQQGAPEN